jgi:hypothetical protein
VHQLAIRIACDMTLEHAISINGDAGECARADGTAIVLCIHSGLTYREEDEQHRCGEPAHCGDGN